MSRVALPGSERSAVASPSAVAAPDETVDLTFVLRRRAELPTELVEGPATLTHDELAAQHGASPDDVALVTKVVEAAGASVTDVHVGSRNLTVSGKLSALTQLLGTSVVLEGGTRRREGGLSLPSELDGVVTAVLGLDERPAARPRFAFADEAAPAVTPVSYPPTKLGDVYDFPKGTDGTGQTVAIIELGGGFVQSQLDSYFHGMGVAPAAVQVVGVDGATNTTGSEADGEVQLDIQVIGCLAPKAQMVCYFGPNTDRGFLDAISAAVHATPTPTVVSISWGQSEDQWTKQSRTSFDQAFADAAALGVTVTAAAGDNGSADSETDGKQHTDFPSASPHVLACGGTNLQLASSGTPTETVWATHGATGGGVSDTFALPTWQKNAGVPVRAGTKHLGRGVPDVAGDADPESGYDVSVNGVAQVIGGTSAVAPLWAALIARLAQGLGKPLGLLQPLLYAGDAPGTPTAGLRDITVGSNGAYSAKAGWDPCTGLGVPEGSALLARLKG